MRGILNDLQLWSFGEWIAAAEYRDAYFESPDDLQLKLEAEFTGFVADKIRAVLNREDVCDSIRSGIRRSLYRWWWLPGTRR